MFSIHFVTSRVHKTSHSSMLCDVNKTERFFSRVTFIISCHKCRLATGSIPLVGSSSNTMDGLPTNARAVESLRLLPRLSELHGLSRYVARSNRSIKLLHNVVSFEEWTPFKRANTKKINKTCDKEILIFLSEFFTFYMIRRCQFVIERIELCTITYLLRVLTLV